jgi:hypothetical protein
MRGASVGISVASFIETSFLHLQLEYSVNPWFYVWNWRMYESLSTIDHWRSQYKGRIFWPTRDTYLYIYENCSYRWGHFLTKLPLISCIWDHWESYAATYEYRGTLQNVLHCGDVEVIAISEIYRAFIGVYFVSGGRITQPSTDIIGQIVTGRIVFLSISGETDNGQYYGLFSVKT